MRKTWLLIVMACYCFILFVGCSQKSEFPVLTDPYLGQNPPGMTAELFDPGIFPEGEHLGCSGFLENGTVFVFGTMKPNADWRLKPVYVMEQKNAHNVP